MPWFGRCGRYRLRRRRLHSRTLLDAAGRACPYPALIIYRAKACLPYLAAAKRMFPPQPPSAVCALLPSPFSMAAQRLFGLTARFRGTVPSHCCRHARHRWMPTPTARAPHHLPLPLRSLRTLRTYFAFCRGRACLQLPCTSIGALLLPGSAFPADRFPVWFVTFWLRSRIVDDGGSRLFYSFAACGSRGCRHRDGML